MEPVRLREGAGVLDGGSRQGVTAETRQGPRSHAPVGSTTGLSPSQRLRSAVGHLARTRPELSAAFAVSPWQRQIMMALLLASALAALVIPTAASRGLQLFLAVPFFFILVLRVIAISHGLAPTARDASLSEDAWDDGAYPIYTILVPLFCEARMVPQLLEALGRLDYPASRLEVFFILESVDAATEAAFATVELPAHMRVIVVPDGTPRTKPRALNYALTFASGTYVTVYDAEDQPDPAQLKRAVRLLERNPEHLGCVQARLAIDNASVNFFTRQFAIEYAALFDIILPALDRLSLPLPLGGTSNHFQRHALEAIGSWDPYNVTEDADLGIRFARHGMKVGVLASTTWEEAPQVWRIWLGQRTRWLKGWMQTYFVHMRRPLALWRELGARRFLGFQVLMGGLILSALVHPWFYLLLGLDAADSALFDGNETQTAKLIWWVCAVNFAAGYFSAILVGVVAVARRGQWRLSLHAVLMPVYWLAISFAAYRAVFQLASAPFYWEKTEHTGSQAGRS